MTLDVYSETAIEKSILMYSIRVFFAMRLLFADTSDIKCKYYYAQSQEIPLVLSCSLLYIKPQPSPPPQASSPSRKYVRLRGRYSGGMSIDVPLSD